MKSADKLRNEEEQNIIRDEVYKKGIISTLPGKGEKRAMICTTQTQINEPLIKRARDYGIEILTIEQVRNLKNRLKERFGEKHKPDMIIVPSIKRVDNVS